VNLRLDHAYAFCVIVGEDLAIFGDGGIGVIVEGPAVPSVGEEGTAGAAGVHGGACGVDVFAEAFVGIVRAGQIGLAGVKWDRSTILNKLINTSMRSSIARSRHMPGAVQNVLNAQIDVVAGAIAGDFDTVREGGKGGVCPAGSTVLRDVLVELVG